MEADDTRPESDVAIRLREMIAVRGVQQFASRVYGRVLTRGLRA